MLSMIKSASLQGMDAGGIVVETDISRGLPSITIIGLGDATVKEAASRIRSAILSSKLDYPNGRITINLSPAWLRKRGSHFDLAMAIGILASSGQVYYNNAKNAAFIGELSLNGEINRCKGVMPMVKALRDSSVNKVVVPKDCIKEASLVEGIEVLGASNLKEVVSWINNQSMLLPADRTHIETIHDWEPSTLDYSEIKGQEAAKRAMTIAAAGGHSILMTGSPGTGKTMIAERLPGILPSLSLDEIIELTSIYSVAGLLGNDNEIVTNRPFRNPGMSLTVPGLLGSGVPPRPGEATLSHKGVLFLDELGERTRELIDSLRIPMEAKEISINRRGETYLYPADFMLVVATNPCKCGNYGDIRKECTCTPGEIQSYRSKLSGPILGRIDLSVELASPEYEELTQVEGMGTKEMKALVLEARKRQEKRGILNCNIEPRMIDSICKMTNSAEKMLSIAYDTMAMEPRGIVKVKKIARTIADMEGAEVIDESHLAEALQYRERLGGRR